MTVQFSLRNSPNFKHRENKKSFALKFKIKILTLTSKGSDELTLASLLYIFFASCYRALLTFY
jgi:hypothetical protein